MWKKRFCGLEKIIHHIGILHQWQFRGPTIVISISWCTGGRGKEVKNCFVSFHPIFNPFSKGGSQHQVTRCVKESWGNLLQGNLQSRKTQSQIMEICLRWKTRWHRKMVWPIFPGNFDAVGKSGGKAGWRGKNNSWGKIQFGRQADIVWKRQCPKFSTCISCFLWQTHCTRVLRN